jgi:ATP-dependent DNA ligase
MLAYKDGSRVSPYLAPGCRFTRAGSAKLAAVIAKLRLETIVLDGEVAVFDENLVSRFHLLGDTDTGVLCTPPKLIAFDVLQVGRLDVRAQALSRRRAILEDAISGSDVVLPVRRMEPRLKAEVSYAELVGERLRAPSWKRLVTRKSNAY